METILTDTEFARLLSVKKTFDSFQSLPSEVDSKSYTLKSIDGNETFTLNIQRNFVCELAKSKLNTSYSRIPIVRVEFNGRPHQNPDGQVIGRSHIHIYREGFGMSWAYDLEGFSNDLFKAPEDFNQLFVDFCTYCNIISDRDIQGVI